MSFIQTALDRMVEAGLPGAFVYVEDANKMSQFHTPGLPILLHVDL